jgi:hypothetical protein
MDGDLAFFHRWEIKDSFKFKNYWSVKYLFLKSFQSDKKRECVLLNALVLIVGSGFT